MSEPPSWMAWLSAAATATTHVDLPHANALREASQESIKPSNVLRGVWVIQKVDIPTSPEGDRQRHQRP